MDNMEESTWGPGVDPEQVMEAQFIIELNGQRINKLMKIKRRVLRQYVLLMKHTKGTQEKLYTVLIRDRAYISIQDLANNN